MELRPYQADAIKALLAYWRAYPSGHPLIVAPTGSGKSVLLAEICRKVLDKRPAYRILIVSHRAEIIKQNAKAIEKHLEKRVSVYSAGLGLKQVGQITCANVQSIFKKDWPETHLLLCDECHLISGRDDSMYGKLIARLQKDNRHLKIVGCSATPYRLDQGSLIGELFTDICYDIEITRLIDDGYLSQLISCPSKSVVDYSDIKKSGYDFKQSDLEAKMLPRVEEQCREIAACITDRKHVLIFTSGISHARSVAGALSLLGVAAEAITGEMLQMERERKLRDFASGKIRALCNCEVLTTGYDFPGIDCVVLLRATMSCGLYSQMVGRGSRTTEGKADCLVLDFGGNIKRHGPIDCIRVGKKVKGKKAEITRAPEKECKQCGCVVAIRVRLCPFCGAEFSLDSTRVELKPSAERIISAPENLPVTNCHFKIGRKGEKPPYFKIEFLVSRGTGNLSLDTVADFLCFAHGGFAAQVACQKWQRYGGKLPFPKTAEEALQRHTELRIPGEIEVRRDGKHYRISKIIGEFKGNDNLETLGINI